jgi:hypothetical protein
MGMAILKKSGVIEDETRAAGEPEGIIPRAVKPAVV